MTTNQVGFAFLFVLCTGGLSRAHAAPPKQLVFADGRPGDTSKAWKAGVRLPAGTQVTFHYSANTTRGLTTSVTKTPGTSETFQVGKDRTPLRVSNLTGEAHLAAYLRGGPDALRTTIVGHIDVKLPGKAQGLTLTPADFANTHALVGKLRGEFGDSANISVMRESAVDPAAAHPLQ